MLAFAYRSLIEKKDENGQPIMNKTTGQPIIYEKYIWVFSVDLKKTGHLKIVFDKESLKKNKFITNKPIDLNKWYNISVEQKPNEKKVRKVPK